jgi:hypothetical protein
VPRGAAKLAVGGRLQPDVALHLYDLADGLVLDLAQLLGWQLTGGEPLAGPE